MHGIRTYLETLKNRFASADGRHAFYVKSVEILHETEVMLRKRYITPALRYITPALRHITPAPCYITPALCYITPALCYMTPALCYMTPALCYMTFSLHYAASGRNRVTFTSVNQEYTNKRISFTF
jgi:hypothetical protein